MNLVQFLLYTILRYTKRFPPMVSRNWLYKILHNQKCKLGYKSDCLSDYWGLLLALQQSFSMNILYWMRSFLSCATEQVEAR